MIDNARLIILTCFHGQSSRVVLDFACPLPPYAIIPRLNKKDWNPWKHAPHCPPEPNRFFSCAACLRPANRDSFLCLAGTPVVPRPFSQEQGTRTPATCPDHLSAACGRNTIPNLCRVVHVYLTGIDNISRGRPLWLSVADYGCLWFG